MADVGKNEKKISKSEKKKILEDLSISETDLKKFKKLKEKPTKKDKKKDYTVYKSNSFAKISNFFMENMSFYLAEKHSKNFDSLFRAIRLSNIKMLSRTYLSMILFSTLITFPAFVIIFFLLLSNIFIALLLGVLVSVGVFGVVYAYPFITFKSRAKAIKRELVFAIIHMAVIASSGAHPVRIFELLVRSGEYKELESEFKRLLNHINLFGYSLSAALKAVSAETSSDELKELLDGMSSTIETGGNLSGYLDDKADDALMKFKLEQKKYLELLATYSEIYVGVVIAAPLLLIITFAILEKISPVIFGMPISLVSIVTTFLFLPLINIFFILFLESTKSGI
jgi:archaellum biogenesis protein FlaJ (TadC family)